MQRLLSKADRSGKLHQWVGEIKEYEGWGWGGGGGGWGGGG